MADVKKGKRSLNLTGSADVVYDLDQLASENTRTDDTKPLIIETRENDPENPEIGRIWLRVKKK
jgi:hypothetical protein